MGDPNDPAMTPAAQLILQGKIELIGAHPFYASLVLRMDFVETKTVPTACIDGKTIWYNPDFVLGQTVRKVAGLLAHEVMHVALQHHLRRFNREPRRWNYACDYAINPMLLAAGMHLPDGGLVDERYLDMAAEEIYHLLPPVDEEDPIGFGEVRDEPGGPDNRDAAATEVEGCVAQAMLDQRMQGDVPAALERLVAQILQPKVDWREVLARFISERSKSDYSWLKPNVRFLNRGIYLPGLDSLQTGAIIMIVDTSGSITGKLIEQFAAEVWAIAGTFSIPVMLIYVDTHVAGVQEIEAEEEIALKPKGGGGTDFRPGFAFIEERELHPCAVVYLTDGCCRSYPEEPAYPVLWAQFGAYPFDPPFGERIRIEYNEHE